jgi:predicted amidohydrolase YtcJ
MGGKAILPGLIDAHVHPWQGGEKVLYMCNFDFSTTPDQLADTISACASSPDAPEWIVGGQWNSNFFVDNNIESPREFLDAVANDHPVFLDDDSAHHGWANTKAMELAGITLSADTADPEGGVFVRDANGIPNGVLLEAAAGVVSSQIPPHTRQNKAAAIAAVSEIANGFGVTAFGDARVPESALLAYQDADNDGELTVHALLYQQSYGHGAKMVPLEPVAAYDARVAKYASPNTHIKAIKFFLDGVPTASRSALMLAPYTTDEQHPESTLGMQMIPTDELNQAVAEFDGAGYLIKIHTAGDGAVRVALDAIAYARAANGNTARPISLAHAGYVAPEDIPRFNTLNAVADFTPYLWYPRPIIDSVVQAVGLPRGAEYWPTKDLLAAGAPINGGSDWPAAAADMNPWPAIESLVTRQHPTNGSDDTFWVEQAISLDEAIPLWTTRAAAIMGFGQFAGEVAVGKSADFIVLNQDPHEIPISAVSETAAEQTWFRGVKVWGQ